MANDMFPVKQSIRDRAHINSLEEYERLYRLSLDNPEWFWGEQSKALDWFHPWHRVLDADYQEVDFAWFSGGRLNACFNCVDRHVPERGDSTAIIWAADEPGVYKRITYRELKHHVARLANVLLERGVKKGDRVAIYAGAVILGGDTVIGDDCVIAGGVFVTASVPPGHTVMQPRAQVQLRPTKPGGGIDDGMWGDFI